MAAGTTITGQIVFEGVPPPKANLLVITTSDYTREIGTSLSESLNGDTGGQPAADGTFVLSGVFGERLFRVNGLPFGWALKAVYVGAREMTDTAVSLDGRDQLTGVQIVVTDRITHLVARVTDEDGEPAEPGAWIFVVPADPATSATFGSRFVRSTVVAQNSIARVEGLPPGDYVAVAIRQTPRQVDVYTPEVLEQVRKTGVKFSLREAETREIVLRFADRPAASAGAHQR